MNTFSWMRLMVFAGAGVIAPAAGYSIESKEFWFLLIMMVLVQIVTGLEHMAKK